jgi:hypothetical protein
LPLKIHHPRRGLKRRILGPMANTITNASSRRTCPDKRSVRQISNYFLLGLIPCGTGEVIFRERWKYRVLSVLVPLYRKAHKSCHGLISGVRRPINTGFIGAFSTQWNPIKIRSSPRHRSNNSRRGEWIFVRVHLSGFRYDKINSFSMCIKYNIQVKYLRLTYIYSVSYFEE